MRGVKWTNRIVGNDCKYFDPSMLKKIIISNRHKEFHLGEWHNLFDVAHNVYTTDNCQQIIVDEAAEMI